MEKHSSFGTLAQALEKPTTKNIFQRIQIMSKYWLQLIFFFSTRKSQNGSIKPGNTQPAAPNYIVALLWWMEPLIILEGTAPYIDVNVQMANMQKKHQSEDFGMTTANQKVQDRRQGNYDRLLA